MPTIWRPGSVEAGLHGLSLLRLYGTFLVHANTSQGAWVDSSCLVLLAIVSWFLDRQPPAWFKDHPLYTFRACSQAGLAQGLLALPTLAAAAAVATRSWWWQQLSLLLVASSFQALVWLHITAAWPAAAHTTSPDSSTKSNASSGANGASDTAASSTRPTAHAAAPRISTRRSLLGRWACLAACGVGMLGALARALLHGLTQQPQQLLPGSVFERPDDITLAAAVLQGALLLGTVPILDHLAKGLPRSFTPGEAAIVVQALLALAGTSTAYLASAALHGPSHLLWSPHVVQPDPGMHVPAFVLLVLFWVLGLGLACTGAAAAGAPHGTSGGSISAHGHGAAAAGKGVTSTPAAARQSQLPPGTDPGSRVEEAQHELTRSGAALRKGAELGSATAGSTAAAAPAAGSGRLQALQRYSCWLLAVVCFCMLVDLALWVLGRFVAASSEPRLATLAYWFSCLAVAVPLMYAVSKATSAAEQQRLAASTPGSGACAPQHQRSPRGEGVLMARVAAAAQRWLAVPHIVMRKGYHLLAILLFLPAFRWDLRMLQASLGVAGAVLVFVEVLRCCGPARARHSISAFMADFADARDSGPLYVTHFTLLLGIAVPIWLSEPLCGAAAAAVTAAAAGACSSGPEGQLGCPAARSSAAAAAARLLPPCTSIIGLSGLVCLGCGDTAAACVGFLLGRRRLFGSGVANSNRKTWEGTVSGLVAMMGSWVAVVWWLDVGWAVSARQWAALAAVTAAMALLEAVTLQLDNVIVPLYYVAHLLLLFAGY